MLAPDGTAFTLGYGITGAEKHDYSYTGYVHNMMGIVGPEPLSGGEHYYTGLRQGLMPVGYWEVRHPMAQCIHSNGSLNVNVHGYEKLGVNINNCKSYYSPGWFPYCAVCGKPIEMFFYIPEYVAATTYYIPTGSNYSTYFYLCPYDHSLEMEAGTNHICTLKSANRYKVRFIPNGATGGNMGDMYFYTGNSKIYEGESISTYETLPLNGYSRNNYIFKGWTISPNGEAMFADGESWTNIQNALGMLSKPNDSVITLYAVWEIAFDMEASIRRCLKDIDGNDLFSRGESGILSIQTKGYSEKTEVIFPGEMSEYNKVFDYGPGNPSNINDENVKFMIPLYNIPEGEWTFSVTVRSYKNGKCIEKKPKVTVLEGTTVLNELYTGLR
ncbi:MAG: hypothetical protein K5669_03430 [Lachnospiraceae bacterium]|nr:hypothetical protein [Lachnospiraceae bacterium]